MEIDKKICIICKKQIEDEKEYVCTDCYNKSVEELKDNELYQELKKNNLPIWTIGALIAFGFMEDKGE